MRLGHGQNRAPRRRQKRPRYRWRVYMDGRFEPLPPAPRGGRSVADVGRCEARCEAAAGQGAAGAAARLGGTHGARRAATAGPAARRERRRLRTGIHARMYATHARTHVRTSRCQRRMAQRHRFSSPPALPSSRPIPSPSYPTGMAKLPQTHLARPQRKGRPVRRDRKRRRLRKHLHHLQEARKPARRGFPTDKKTFPRRVGGRVDNAGGADVGSGGAGQPHGHVDGLARHGAPAGAVAAGATPLPHVSPSPTPSRPAK